MRRRPARPTLFPYTTLFRSGQVVELNGHTDGWAIRAHPTAQRPHGKAAPLKLGAALPCGRCAVGWARMAQDRKSTRLNSSHSQISYAVFCLKKKKNITQRYS